VFPQNTILAARIALVGLSEGWGEEFCRAAYRAEFGEGRDIGNPATLAEILAALRQDSTRVLAQAQTDEIKSALRAQTDEAQTLGIFGAPSFVTRDGELFWGNDRLEAALDWARR
jgi:2-hydroxychromene-2-carboxylate isomerase